MTDTPPPPDTPALDDHAATITTATAAITTATSHHDAADRLDTAAALLAAIDRLTAAVITILQASDHDQVIADHGLTRDSWLRAIAGRTAADAGMLLAAADRLPDMPAVTAWFHHGHLSWGAVRAIVTATRTLTADQRAWIDHTLHTNHHLLRCDGDQIAAAVDSLAAQARPDLHADRETSTLTRRWLTIQPRLDGTADIAGSLDAETAAAALAAFTTAPIHHDDHDRDPRDDHRDDGDNHGGAATATNDADHTRAARRRTNVDIFKQLCEQRLTRHHHPNGRPDTDTDTHTTARADRPATADGAHTTTTATDGDEPDVHGRTDGADTNTDGRAAANGRQPCRHCGAAPSTARPAFLVIADLSTLDPHHPTASGTARLHWATTHAPVELTPAAAQRLACDATLRAVITHDTDVLGVTAAHPKVSATLRAALIARDGGCRFPACTQPADLCDTHHVTPVAMNGPTTLDNLALVCRDHHHAIHDGRWTTKLHTDTTMTFTRRGVTRTSQPRARQHPQPAQPPPAGRPHRRHHTATRRQQPPGPQRAGGDEPDSEPDPVNQPVPF